MVADGLAVIAFLSCEVEGEEDVEEEAFDGLDFCPVKVPQSDIVGSERRE